MEQQRDAVALLRRKLHLQKNTTISLQKLVEYVALAHSTICKTIGTKFDEVAAFVRSHSQIFLVSENGVVSIKWSPETEGVHLLLDILAVRGKMCVTSCFVYFTVNGLTELKNLSLETITGLSKFMTQRPLFFHVSENEIIGCTTMVLIEGFSDYSSDNVHVIILSVINIFLVYGLHNANVKDIRTELFKGLHCQGDAGMVTCDGLKEILCRCFVFEVDAKGNVAFRMESLTPELMMGTYIRAVLSNEKEMTVQQLLAKIMPFQMTKDLKIHTVEGLKTFLESILFQTIDDTLEFSVSLQFEAVQYIHFIVNGEKVPIEILGGLLAKAPKRIQNLIGQDIANIKDFLLRNAPMFHVTKDQHVYFDKEVCTFLKKEDDLIKSVKGDQLLSFELSDCNSIGNLRLGTLNGEQVQIQDASALVPCIMKDDSKANHTQTEIPDIRRQDQIDTSISINHEGGILDKHLNALKAILVTVIHNRKMTISKLYESLDKTTQSLFTNVIDFEKFLRHYEILSFEEESVCLKTVSEGYISEISKDSGFVDGNKDVSYKKSAIYNPQEAEVMREGTHVKYVAVDGSLLPTPLCSSSARCCLLIWSITGSDPMSDRQHENQSKAPVSIQNDQIQEFVTDKAALFFLVEIVKRKKGINVQGLTDCLAQASPSLQRYLKGPERLTSFMKAHKGTFQVRENGCVFLHPSMTDVEQCAYGISSRVGLLDDYECELWIIKHVTLLLLLGEELSFGTILSTLRDGICEKAKACASEGSLAMMLSKYKIFIVGKTTVCLRASPKEGYIVEIGIIHEGNNTTKQKQKVYYQASAVYTPPQEQITNELDYNLKINSRVKYIYINTNEIASRSAKMTAILVWPSSGPNLMKLRFQLAEAVKYSPHKELPIPLKASLTDKLPAPTHTPNTKKKITLNLLKSAKEDPVTDLALLLTMYTDLLNMATFEKHSSSGVLHSSKMFNSNLEIVEYVRFHPSTLQMSADKLVFSSVNIPTKTSTWCSQNAEIIYLTVNTALAKTQCESIIYVQRKTFFYCGKDKSINRELQQHKMKSVLQIGDKISCYVVPFKKPPNPIPPGADNSKWMAVITWHSSHNASLQSILDTWNTRKIQKKLSVTNNSGGASSENEKVSATSKQHKDAPLTPTTSSERLTNDIKLSSLVTLLAESIHHKGVPLHDVNGLLDTFKSKDNPEFNQLYSAGKFRAYLLEHGHMLKVHEAVVYPACEYSTADVVVKSSGTVAKIESGNIFMRSTFEPQITVCCSETMLYPMTSIGHKTKVGDHIHLIAAVQNDDITSWKVLFAWHNTGVSIFENVNLICLHDPSKAQTKDSSIVDSEIRSSSSNTSPLKLDQAKHLEHSTTDCHLDNSAGTVGEIASTEEIIPSLIGISKCLTNMAETMLELSSPKENVGTSPHLLAQGVLVKKFIGALEKLNKRIMSDTVLNEQMSCVNNELALSSYSEDMLSEHTSRSLGQVLQSSDDCGTKEMDAQQQIGEIVSETSDQSAPSKEDHPINVHNIEDIKSLPENQNSPKVEVGAGLPITGTGKGLSSQDSVAYVWCKAMVQYKSRLVSKSETTLEPIHGIKGPSAPVNRSSVDRTLSKVINTSDKYCQTKRVSQTNSRSQTLSTGHITMSRYLKS